MSKRQLKIFKIEARKRIEAQIEKGKQIGIRGSGIIKGKYTREISARDRDNFENIFKQWNDITVEILKEIFMSSSYSIDFDKQHTSEKEYASSNWVPDIAYYLKSQLISKLEEVFQIYNIEKLTLAKFVKILTIPQIYKIMGVILIIIIGSFGFGYKIHSWMLNNEEYQLSIENKKLIKENNNLESQIDSLKSGINTNK